MEADFEQMSYGYRLNAEYYLMYEEDKLKHVQALMVFSGILCQMESDVLLYRSKHGTTDKIKPAMDRVNDLREVYDHLNGLFERNEQFKIMFRHNHNRCAKAEMDLEKERTKNINIEEWNSE